MCWNHRARTICHRTPPEFTSFPKGSQKKTAIAGGVVSLLNFYGAVHCSVRGTSLVLCPSEPRTGKGLPDVRSREFDVVT